MLYDPTVSSLFPKLTEGLKMLGASEEVLSAVSDYLDTSKPRNDALLDNIQPARLSVNSRSGLSAFQRALNEEIDKSRDPELFARWRIFCYAISGEFCNEMGMWTGYQRSDSGWDEFRNEIVKVLRTRYGDETEARMYAAEITNTTANQYYQQRLSFSQNAMKPPALSAAALRFTQTDLTKLMLTLFIFDQSMPEAPQKGLKALFSKPDPNVQTALDTLGTLEQNWNPKSNLTGYLLLTMAAAARFSETWRKRFLEKMHLKKAYSVAADPAALTEMLFRFPINPSPIVELLTEIPCDKAFISMIAACITKPKAYRHTAHILPDRDAHLRVLAERYPQTYREAMLHVGEDGNSWDPYSYYNNFPSISKRMGEIYCEVHPDASVQTELLDRARQETAASICKRNEKFQTELKAYLFGEAEFDSLLSVIPQLERSHWGYRNLDYTAAYGLDEFAQRCICLQTAIQPNNHHAMGGVPHYQVTGHQEEFIEILRRHNVPLGYILSYCGKLDPDLRTIDKEAGLHENLLMKALQPFAGELADTDRKTLTPEGRILALHMLHEAGMTEQLFSYADDSSKAVRAELVELLPQAGGEWDGKIISLLSEKKLAWRDTAVALLEKYCPASLRSEVEAALAREKNAGLQTRLAALLGDVDAGTPRAANTVANLVSSLTKGAKSRKVDWLFQTAFSPVHMTDGTEAEEMYLRALCICYVDQNPLGRSTSADQLAANLSTGDLERFAQEVFARWIAQSAPAKTKWVLYLTAIHGGMEAITAFQHYIREWAENARTAIASEAVMALALNGSSAALMAVDNLTRKGKGAKVKNAARDALQCAANALHITTEELADRIIPDLGFDENCCRIFDFGTRQFKVYLTSTQTLEVFEGEKKLKNLPKPAAKDDPERSAEAVKAFKEMKKQMKTALELQQKRLESALNHSRRWTAEDWQALFIRKPIMHSFAIGLIWGVYEDNQLTATFRYMEDGSFNTADEEEFELPENAMIGLVHPIELDEETRDTWQEQLTDYEIAQPFPQISRPVYRVEEDEQKAVKLLRYTGAFLNGATLTGRMERLNWFKGAAMDAGYFYEFRKMDILHSGKREDGTSFEEGYQVTLHFSGMYIGAYTEQEDVTVEYVEFYKLQGRLPLKLKEVEPQYFSEIIYQLEQILGAAPKKSEEEDA